MSMELWVGLPAGATIDRAGVEAEAKRLGLALSLDQDFSLDEVGGFRPGRLEELQAGIEVSVYGGSDIEEMLEPFGAEADTLARIVAFYWGASFAEGAFADGLAAVLVSACGGICYDPEGDELLGLDQLVQAARDMAAEARKQPAA
jgi:hypothetical protein